MVKVVLVCTAAPELKGHPTGVWIEELAAPYAAFEEKGYEIVIASPAGGPIPIDQGSMAEMFFTEPCKKFMHDSTAVGKLSHSVKLADVDFASADAIYLTGGHGTCVDFVDTPELKTAIESLYAADKVVAAVCHGVVGLVQCTSADGKTPFVAGKTVTGFTDAEENAVQLTEKVPFLLQSKLVEQGCKFENAAEWNSKVCVDGKLATGQNPQSSEELAVAVIGLLEEEEEDRRLVAIMVKPVAGVDPETLYKKFIDTIKSQPEYKLKWDDKCKVEDGKIYSSFTISIEADFHEEVMEVIEYMEDEVADQQVTYQAAME